MKANTVWLLWILVIPFCLLGLNGFAADRVALVIGNNDYSDGGNFPDLNNCLGDARLIELTLKSVGFEVILVENATLSEMDDALLNFEGEIKKGGTALVYFAGHGIEYNGQNYLMASNAELKARSRLSEEALKAETFASAMILAGAKSSFLLLDCCRDVPGDSEWATRGRKKQGLAQIDIDGDIIIGFAATPGKAALEPGVEGGNSPYATALAKWIPEGLDHRDIFDEVRREVHQITGGLQRTWESGSFLQPFFFSKSDELPSISSVEFQKMRSELEALRNKLTTMPGVSGGGHAADVSTDKSENSPEISTSVQAPVADLIAASQGGIMVTEDGSIAIKAIGSNEAEEMLIDVGEGTSNLLKQQNNSGTGNMSFVPEDPFVQWSKLAKEDLSIPSGTNPRIIPVDVSQPLPSIGEENWEHDWWRSSVLKGAQTQDSTPSGISTIMLSEDLEAYDMLSPDSSYIKMSK